MGYTRKRARGRRQARIDDRRYLDPDCKKFNSKIRRKFITRVNWVFKVSEHTQHNNRPSLLVSNRIVWLLPFFGHHLPPSLLGNLSLTPPPLLATRAPTIFSHSILSLFTPSPPLSTILVKGWFSFPPLVRDITTNYRSINQSTVGVGRELH